MRKKLNSGQEMSPNELKELADKTDDNFNQAKINNIHDSMVKKHDSKD